MKKSEIQKIKENSGKRIDEGYYVDFYELPDGKLRMILNHEKMDDFKNDIYDLSKKRGIDYAFCEMIEDYLSNGWHIFTDSEVAQMGALTSATLFGFDYEYDDSDPENDYNLKSVGRVYFNGKYDTKNEIEEMLNKGFYDFDFVD